MAAFSQASVLVADDDDEIREAITELLADEGYAVIPVRDGKQAIDYLEAAPEPPTVILLDLMMPVLNGWECLRVIRSGARSCAIPVVVITAVTRDRPAGADAILTKPFGMADVRKAVEPFARAAARTGGP